MDEGERRRPDTRVSALDGETLDVLIVQQWTKMLKEPYDWAEWPLARYTIAEDVVRAVQARGAANGSAPCADPGAARLAWVCAMVACGRAARLKSLDPVPMLDSSGEALVRADGARGWRCDLRRAGYDGAQLRYWVNPSGLIEFDAICNQEVPCPV